MKTPNEQKQKVKEKAKQITSDSKSSNCCGPTCCGGSNDQKNSSRKEN